MDVSRVWLTIDPNFGDLVFPRYAPAIGQVTGILTLGELPIILWLLIRGAKPQRATSNTSN